MSKKILVTGANGQLGVAIRHAMVLGQASYMFVGRNDLDITDKEAVRDIVKKNDINIIINCAAYTNVEKAAENEDEFNKADEINSTAVRYLAEIMKEVDGLLIHISSDYVYDGEGNHPYKESENKFAVNEYGLTKLRGELNIIESGCKYIIIRTSWLYYEYGNNFVKTILGKLTTAKSLNVVVDQIGSPTYAGDLADAICILIETDRYKNYYGVVNYSNEGAISWYDFAQAIKELAGGDSIPIYPCKSDEYPSNVRRPAYSVMDKSLFKEVYGLGIPYWRDSLKKCIEKIV